MLNRKRKGGALSDIAVFGIIALVCVAFAWFCSSAIRNCSREIDKHGLKNIIERIWEGEERK